MVRGSNIMKPPSFPKNANGSGNQLLVKGGSTSSQNINSHAAIMAVNGIMGGGGALSEQP
jgi:hypothetical protein